MLFFLAAAWITVGVIGVGVMRHRGHDTFAWALLFLVLGPLAVPLAISSDRSRPPEPELPSHDGSLDVLVACNGSAEHAPAIQAALRLVAERITSVTVATVVDLEAPTTVRGRETQREADDCLGAIARALSPLTDAPVDTVILYGQPKDTLQRFAAEHGYELIIADEQVDTGLSRPRHRFAPRPPAAVPVLIAPASR